MVNFGSLTYIGDPNNLLLNKPIYNNALAAGGSNYVQWLNVGNVTATPVLDSNGVVTSCTYTGTGVVTNPQCQPNFNYTMLPRRLNGVRQMTLNNMNANVQRHFRLGEKVTFEARLETYNTFNHQVLAGPNTNPTYPNFGRVTGEGFPNNSARWISILGRLQF